jgi:hypothetical protein
VVIDQHIPLTGNPKNIIPWSTNYVFSLPMVTHHCSADHQPAPEPWLSETESSSIALATTLHPLIAVGSGAIHSKIRNPFSNRDQFQHLQPSHRIHRDQPGLDLAGLGADAEVSDLAKQPPNPQRHTLYSLQRGTDSPKPAAAFTH